MSAAAAKLSDLADPTAKPKGKGKLILLAVPVLLIGLAAGGWFSGILPKLLGMDKTAATEVTDGKVAKEGKPAVGDDKDAKAPPLVFLDVPEIIANLNVGSRRASFVKLKAKLELARPGDVPVVTAAMPRLLDLFQTYLRDMRPEELRGSAGSYRLREELLARATIAASPARISDVLFTELLVQ